MINLVPTAFPEPAAPAPAAPQKVDPNDRPDAAGFDALLDEHTDVASDGLDQEGPKDSPIEAEATPPEATAPDSVEPSDANETNETDVTPPSVDTTVLSSQLAMWQILPPQVVAAGPTEAKIAAPSAADGLTEVADSSGGVAPENISAALENPSIHQASAGSVSESVSTPMTAKPESAAALPAQQAVEATPALPKGSTPPPANPLADKVSPEVTDVLPRVHAHANGIPVAKQQRVMSDLEFHPAAATETAVLAGSNVAGISAAAVMPVAAGSGQNFQEPSRDETGAQPDGSLAGAPLLSPESKSLHATKATEFPATVHAADATKVIEQIERATEHLRAQGGQRIELRLPMQDGGELLVRLQMSGGELKAVFRTESAGLRDALQAGWSQYAAGSPERELKVGQAVFESPSTQSEMNSFSQTPDQRSRHQAFAEAESSGKVSAPISLVSKPIRAAHSTPVANSSASGLQIYA